MSRDFNSGANDSSVTTTKCSIKKMIRLTENITMTTRELNIVNFGDDKENRFVKQTESTTNVVKQIQVHCEELSTVRTSRTNVNHDPQNATSTGAIKKRKNSDSQNDSERSKHFVPKKRAGIRDSDTFQKTRFRIYNDRVDRVADKEETIDESHATGDNQLQINDTNKYDPLFSCQAVDKRLDRIKLPELNDKFSARVTPNDIPALPPPAKKVKLLYRDRLLTKSERPAIASGSVSRDPEYDLPYDECLIEQELEREIKVSKLSKNLRRQNITVEQRKIIVKFLTRLNSHLFLPSFFLYQTVKLFDTVLDTKIVEVKDFQLIALAAMWIALKREVIVYNIPSAEKMISFAKDLYEGKVDLLLKCEIDILQTLNFSIVFPDPFSIMCYNITKCYHSQFLDSSQIHRAYCCGSYMIDVALFDEEMMKISVVLLAGAAAEAALFFTMETPHELVEPEWSVWRAPHMKNRFSDGAIGTVRLLLIRKTFESQKRHSDTDIVFKKYTRSRYGRISHFLGTKAKAYLNEE